MKLASSEMEAETERWQDAPNGAIDENSDIVKRAKNMSRMAFSMYQFTKGSGTLKTTQDLFTQAEYFAEEANRLYKIVRQFSYQVPGFYIPVTRRILILGGFKIFQNMIHLVQSFTYRSIVNYLPISDSDFDVFSPSMHIAFTTGPLLS